MLGKKKFKHPADAFRKRLRKKEIKRNKEQRDERRNQIILAKDEDSLKAEIKKYDLLESKNRLEPRHKIIKQKLKTALNAKIAEKQKRERLKQSGTVKGLQKIIDHKNKNLSINKEEEKLSGKSDFTEKSDFGKKTNLAKTDFKFKERTGISEDIIKILNSFEADGQPFFPPGLTISEVLTTPPGIFTNNFTQKSKNNFANKITFLNKIDHKTNLENNNFNKFDNRESIDDPLNPEGANYQNFDKNLKFGQNVKNEFKFDQNVKNEFKFDQNVKNEFKFGQNNQKTEKTFLKTVYQRKEEFNENYGKIPKGLLKMVPRSVKFKTKNSKTKQSNQSKRLNLAPNVTNNEDDYQNLMKDINRMTKF